MDEDKIRTTVNIDVRSVESDVATEIFISAIPTAEGEPADQAQQMFSGIRQILCSKGAHIFQERVFGVQDVIEVVSEVRSKAYGDIDDGVGPAFLVAGPGRFGRIAGVQVHAIVSNDSPDVLNLDQRPCGRFIRLPDIAFLALSGICADEAVARPDQARDMLQKAEAVLRQVGSDFLSVARTWMWLRDILSWYDDFNRVRNDFFTERRIIGPGTRQSMPASTGIGLSPANQYACSMDLAAVVKPADSIQYLQAVGKQQCAFEYGSAFSRACRAVTPAGQTVYVSGTASIDTSGATTHIGDAAGQINTTIENVRAVLADMQCRDADVVQVMAYCKTPEVEEIFNGLKDKLDWPWLTLICDVCRPDLLFEIEAGAIPRK